MTKNIQNKGNPGPRQVSAGQRQRAYNRMRHRKRMQVLFYIVIFLIVIITAVTLSISILFKIQSIEVEGKSRYTVQQITQSCGITTGQNLITAKVKGAADKIKRACPYLGEVTVKRCLPAKIVIKVQEATASGAVVWNNRYVLLDSSGKVLEISKTAPASIPTVKGLTVVSAKVGNQVAYKDTERSALFQQIAAAVKVSGMTGVHSIDVTNEYDLNLSCSTVGGGFLTVKLGNSTYLEKKLRFVKATIGQHLSGEYGTFDVSSVGKEKSVTWFTPASSASSSVSSAASSASSLQTGSKQTKSTSESGNGTEEEDNTEQSGDNGE